MPRQAASAKRTPLHTSLPATPLDGQEVYLAVDTAALYGGPYLWHCRYNAAIAGTSKWEVVHGEALRLEQIGGRNWNGRESTASLTYTNLPTGCAISIPVTGVYEMTCSAVAGAGVGVLAGCFMQLTGEGTPTWDGGDAVNVPGAAGAGASAWACRTRSLPAGQAVHLWHATSSAANAAFFYNRCLYLRPIRIG